MLIVIVENNGLLMTTQSPIFKNAIFIKSSKLVTPIRLPCLLSRRKKRERKADLLFRLVPSKNHLQKELRSLAQQGRERQAHHFQGQIQRHNKQRKRVCKWLHSSITKDSNCHPTSIPICICQSVGICCDFYISLQF